MRINMDSPKNKPISTTMPALLILSCIWVLMALVANPIGDFPLNDDWSYGRTVYYLVEEGRLRFSGWLSAPLIAQVFWGALFCLPFGFSFTALRLSTLSIGLIGIFAVYGLLRETRIRQAIAFLGALIVATNPIYFELSNTFMTDVPFFAFAMLSLLFLIRGLRRENTIEILIGLSLASGATFIRESGMVIPLSFGISYLAKNGISKKSLLMALLPALLILGALIGYEMWLQSTIGLPSFYNVRRYQLLDSLKAPIRSVIVNFGTNASGALIYLALFLLPFLTVVIPLQWKSVSYREGAWNVLISFGLVIVLIGELLWKKELMPLSGNILFDIGLGPPTLRDVYILQLPHLPSAPKSLWLLMTVAGVIGAAVVVQTVLSVSVRLFHWRKNAEPLAERWLVLLVVLSCALYFIPLGILGFFDRHLIFFLPLLMMLTAMTARNSTSLHLDRLSVFIVVALLLVYGTFALGATHDYLSWNRARWNALRYLTEEAHISHKYIDGGFEFNGWYGYDPDYPVKLLMGQTEKSWWWVDKDDYVISFGPIRGYDEIRRYPYKRWIPFGQGEIFVLHRASNSGTEASTLNK